MIVGQKWLAAETLKLCLRLGHTVVKVVAPTADDRLIQTAIETDTHAVAVAGRLEGHHVLDGTDLIIAAHAHCFITSEARQKARDGAIGYHPSLLPLHRGRDAIKWAIRMHEPVTGGTVYQMDDRADAGPIIAQDWCFIRKDDTADSLWRRELGPMGLILFEIVLTNFESLSPVSSEQDEKLSTWEPALINSRLN
ncbi:formyltransferase family protein [Undibacterium sp. Di27W]|uniref:formyltransferase family protein n=1 Tax=Undibacterium sp. Di27W TaxID=3413036 RepID=UPI003BF016D4